MGTKVKVRFLRGASIFRKDEVVELDGGIAHWYTEMLKCAVVVGEEPEIETAMAEPKREKAIKKRKVKKCQAPP